MISGVSEEELLLAKARADIIMVLDNTSTYENWLIIDTYIEKLEEENERLKNNWNELKKHFKRQTIDLEKIREEIDIDYYVGKKMFLGKILSKMQELEEKEEN